MSLFLAMPIAFGVGLLAERMGWLRPKAAWAAALVGGLVWLEVPIAGVVLGGVAGALADTLLGLCEDRWACWNNDLTNLLATTLGGLVAASLARIFAA